MKERIGLSLHEQLAAFDGDLAVIANDMERNPDSEGAHEFAFAARVSELRRQVDEMRRSVRELLAGQRMEYLGLHLVLESESTQIHDGVVEVTRLYRGPSK